jgi:hypothetical protein
MPDYPLPNYQQPLGTRKILITNHNGPALYVAGGETVNANTFGWGSFDGVRAGYSVNANNSGNFYAVPIFPVGQAANNVSGANSVKLKWFSANGTEATNNNNLALEYIRMEYIGG